MSPQPTQPPQAHLKETAANNFEMTQPKLIQPMNPQQAPAQTEQSTKLNLRGGDRGGMCPGRFCFCVPCPIPCDFCII